MQLLHKWHLRLYFKYKAYFKLKSKKNCLYYNKVNQIIQVGELGCTLDLS